MLDNRVEVTYTTWFSTISVWEDKMPKFIKRHAMINGVLDIIIGTGDYTLLGEVSINLSYVLTGYPLPQTYT